MNAAVTPYPGKWWFSWGLVPLLTLLAAFSGARAETPLVEVGGWWDAQGERVVEDQVMDQLDRADVILLGEVHDSDAIHRRQVELLSTLNSADRPVVLAMEQLDRRGEGEIGRMNDDSLVEGRERAEAGGFDFDGWGWDQYGRLFEWAAQHQAPLWPLNLSRDKAMAVAMADGDGWRDQMDSGTLAWIDNLAPSLSLPDEQQNDLLDVLESSHCQEVSSSMSNRMLRAQVARDLVMAESIMAARDAHPDHRVVAVMGNQHARFDRGVGYWLSRLAEDERPVIMSVGMVPINHLDANPGPDDAFDLMWIAPEVKRDDPCAAVGGNRDEE